MTSIECMYLRVRMDRDLCMRNDGGLATAEQVSNHESVWSVLLASLTTFAAFFTDKITYRRSWKAPCRGSGSRASSLRRKKWEEV